MRKVSSFGEPRLDVGVALLGGGELLVGLGVLGGHEQELDVGEGVEDHAEGSAALEVEVTHHGDGAELRAVVLPHEALHGVEVDVLDGVVVADGAVLVDVALGVQQLGNVHEGGTDGSGAVGAGLVAHAQLVADDALLGLDVFLGHAGDAVGEAEGLDAEEGHGGVHGGHRHVVGPLPGGGGVEHAAQLVDDVPVLGEVTVLGAEGQVLHGVGDALRGQALGVHAVVDGAAVDPVGDGHDGLGVVRLEQDTQSAREAVVDGLDVVPVELERVVGLGDVRSEGGSRDEGGGDEEREEHSGAS